MAAGGSFDEITWSIADATALRQGRQSPRLIYNSPRGHAVFRDWANWLDR